MQFKKQIHTGSMFFLLKENKSNYRKELLVCIWDIVLSQQP